MSIVKKCVSYLKQKRSRPRLSVKDLGVYSANCGLVCSNKQDSWIDSIIDALIISGLTFFSTLGGDTVSGLYSIATLKAATIAACIQFFIFLSIKRGIRRATNKQQKSTHP
jgi:hypothetical protein